MKIGTIQLNEFDGANRLTPSSYLDLEDHSLEISASITVKSKRKNGRQINGTESIKVRFTMGQVGGIVRAHNAKSVDEVREIVSDLIRGNIVAALTEATRKAR